MLYSLVSEGSYNVELNHSTSPVFTADVFQWLAGNSTHSLNITAQYWELLATPNDSRSGDYGYTEAQMQQFGAYEGSDVYNAIAAAGNRNVTVRYEIRKAYYIKAIEAF